MNNFFNYLFFNPSFSTVEIVLCFMRVAIGILTIFHGVPKIMGGVPMWRELGTFVYPMGIHFWPLMWGFLGACTEFFGGIALAVGFGTRIASFALVFMMIIATVWHLSRKDSYNVYSFPLSLIFVYLTFMIIGGGKYSLDSYFFQL